MEKILILKDVAYAEALGGGTIADITEVNLLADGALAIFTEDGTLVTAASAATDFADQKKFAFFVGSGNAAKGAMRSDYIDRETSELTFQAYVAPTAQLSFIGEDGAGGATGSLNLPNPLVPGNTIGFKIIETTTGTLPPIMSESWEYVIKSGDTATSIITALILAAQPSNIATVVVVGAQVGIQIEAKPNPVTGAFDRTFELAVTGDLVNATVYENGASGSNSTPPIFGHGTPESLIEMENWSSTEYGNTNQTYLAGKYWKHPSQVVSGESYDIYTIYWSTRHNVITPQTPLRVFIRIAMPEGASTIPQADFDSIMAEAVGTFESIETGS